MTKIISITPAPLGWFAAFNEGTDMYLLPIALWALAEDEEGNTYPTSFSASDLDPLDKADHDREDFAGYIFLDPTKESHGKMEPKPHRTKS